MTRILIILTSLIMLAACSNAINEKANTVTVKSTLSGENKNLVELIKSGEYQKVIDKCRSSKDKDQQNLFKISSALKLYDEVKNTSFNNVVAGTKYNTIQKILDNVSIIPNDLMSRVKKVKEDVARKVNLYEKSRNDNGDLQVVIGMNEGEVIDILGKPEDINRTTTSSGISEQWVYPNGYVYFEDGIVDTIQN